MIGDDNPILVGERERERERERYGGGGSIVALDVSDIFRCIATP